MNKSAFTHRILRVLGNAKLRARAVRRRKARRKSAGAAEGLESRQLLTTFTVDSLLDGTQSGVTTLREAIDSANSNPGADSIVFQDGLTGKIDLTEGELVITDDLTITGGPGYPGWASDLVIDAQQNSRVIRATNTVTNLTLKTITVANGKTTDATDGGGGGIRFEGVNGSTLELITSTVSGNTSASDGGGIWTDEGDVTVFSRFNEMAVIGNASAYDGGGIFTGSGDVTLEYADISDNTSGNNGGGIWSAGDVKLGFLGRVIGNSAAYGGGIMSYGDVELASNSSAEVTGNTATYDGGGIMSDGGDVTLSDGTVSGNTSGGSGGGISTVDGAVEMFFGSEVSGNRSGVSGGGIAADGDVRLFFGSEVSGNTSGLNGGGIFTANGGDVLTRGTVSGNTATDGAGGGISADGDVDASGSIRGNTSGLSGGGISADGDVTLVRATVALNTSGLDGGGISDNGGVLTVVNSTVSGNTASGAGGGISSSGSLTSHNSIIAGNSDDGTAPDFKATGNLAFEHNIIGDTTGTTLTPGNNNQLNVDFTTVIQTEVVNGNTVPRVLNSGGILLPIGSPAIDAGDNALAVGFSGEPLGGILDGDSIPGAIVDIGAYEYSKTVIVGTGNVSARLQKSNLIITGDTGDNVVAISQSGSTVTVSGLYGTLIDGSTSETFNVSLADINIKLPDGHNQVMIDGVTVSDDIKVKGGKDVDEIYIVDSNVASDINVNLGDNHDQLFVNHTNTNRIKAKTGNGHDTLAFANVNVNTDFLVNTGGGFDDVAFEGVTIGDDVNLVTGSGPDSVHADDFHVADVLKISLGSGVDFLWMKDTSGGKTTLNGGSDTDWFCLHSSTFGSKIEKGFEGPYPVNGQLRIDALFDQFARQILLFG